MKNDQNHFDYFFVLAFILFFVVSCISIYHAQVIGEMKENVLLKQIVWYGVGGIIIFVVMLFDMEQIQRLRWYIYCFSIFLLIVLILSPESIARKINGAKSWFTFIPGISFQPSELSKIGLIICLSYVISQAGPSLISMKQHLLLLGKMTLLTFIPILCIMGQPDLGTSLVLLFIFAGMVLVSGISWKLILPVFLTLLIVGGGSIYLILFEPDFIKALGVKQYQLGRIYAWLDPETYKQGDGYHLYQSLLGVGSGQLQGMDNSDVHIPESHTDFIFSVIANKFGFYGAGTVICLYFFLLYRMIRLSIETKDSFSSFVCIGVITMITFHTFQNIGMTIGLLPITGIPLPFISYGGSAMIGNMLALGLVMSISLRNKKYFFDS
ncbi:FtsW/RodA/SpoVE family cell cycle protein [Bacillus weihaiensis]|uniref:Rod shape-determining protein RodA n=1 Tax=Bacillus weihaiensis TaxID=1547283 RepID=A0A1L3MTG6_9BACI|nr:FtsW/RodA/SpoVE family cell cycle protein [Bacillus weihaiensis]APH05648.1 rod shape-determining protein RodA [Bacillus weihaiensis]